MFITDKCSSQSRAVFLPQHTRFGKDTILCSLPSFFSALSPAASSWLEASPLACSQLSKSSYFSNSDTGCPTLMKMKPGSCVEK